MAFRPYENLIDGELDNRSPGKVAGWIRFFRRDKEPLTVTLDLEGDFHEDIRGKVLRLKNPTPSDRNQQLEREGTYVESLTRIQRGSAGDITAGLSLGPWTPELAEKLIAQYELVWDERGVTGSERQRLRRELAESCRGRIDAGELYYPYVLYPYVEWFSDTNGRVVLELEHSQVEVLNGDAPIKQKTPEELFQDERKRQQAMAAFFFGLTGEFSRESRNT